jgi:hypothetical protein
MAFGGLIFPATSITTVILPCGQKVIKTWIAIKLVDENDRPIPNEKYIIIFPDGTKKEGNLDANGYAYFDGIPPGICTVGFPDFGPFCSFVSTLTQSQRTDPSWAGWTGPSSSPLPPAQAPTWVDVRLLDQSGAGVAGEKYEIELPNGDVAQGFLQPDGTAHVDGIIPAGDCKICFPELDKTFVSFEKSQ